MRMSVVSGEDSYNALILYPARSGCGIPISSAGCIHEIDRSRDIWDGAGAKLVFPTPPHTGDWRSNEYAYVAQRLTGSATHDEACL